MEKRLKRSVVLRVHLLPQPYSKLMGLCERLRVSPGVILGYLIAQLDSDQLCDSVRRAGGNVYDD